MTTLLVVLWVAILTLLVLVVAVRFTQSSHAWFELRRRGDTARLHRERLLPAVVTFRSVVAVVLVAILVAFAVVLWQWWTAVIVLVGVIVLPLFVRLRPVRRAANRLYGYIEPRVLGFVGTRLVLFWLGGTAMSHDQKLESTEQLLHLIDTSGQVLTDNQKNIIKGGISWHETSVASVMTPRKHIKAVKHSELIGPLVLSDLHATGYTRFPVMRGNIDNIIGILDITALIEISSRSQSQTAEKHMSPAVLRIELDESLPYALELLQKSKEHVLIVIDTDGNTAGIVTLSDITQSLLGAGRDE